MGKVLAVSSILTILATPDCATVTPATQAEEMEHLQCDSDTSNGKDMKLVESMSVLAVNPVYSYMHNGRTGTDRRIKGVKLLVRVPESVSSSLLLRSLQCHCARMTLGHESLASLPNDPFWLPNAWVDIESTPRRGQSGSDHRNRRHRRKSSTAIPCQGVRSGTRTPPEIVKLKLTPAHSQAAKEVDRVLRHALLGRGALRCRMSAISALQQ